MARELLEVLDGSGIRKGEDAPLRGALEIRATGSR